MQRARWIAALPLVLGGCAAHAPPAPSPSPSPEAPVAPAPSAVEPHLADIRQLTFGGENAEAYWSWAGDQLILQARPPGVDCDRIYRTKPLDPQPSFLPVSDGKGATTCSFFLPGDQDVIYASTELGGAACPPRPDHSKGYVWALYPDYDIFRAKADGSGVVRLTDAPGYDAEGTVCGRDGSIVFTSVRDGDIDLYRMDADGKNVRRLTDTPGYDGGAFFNADCTKIVWRASRPKGKDLDDYRALLAQNLVRPTELELYVANADGTEAQQITYLGAASFAPYWHPSQQRILFASNYGAASPREFDIWAVDVQGTRLERITAAPEFDGFPMFSPDGAHLAFSSNRATAPGKHDTNVFVARWVEGEVHPVARAADRILADAAWLADPAREGRGVGTRGLDEAGAHIEESLRSMGLAPAGADGGFRQGFEVRVSMRGEANAAVGGQALDGAEVRPLGFSASASVDGRLAFAGYGVTAEGWDDYARADVKGKIAVVRRFVPDVPLLSGPDDQRRHGDLYRKAWLAREHGATALIVVDVPERPKGAAPSWAPPEEAPFPELTSEVTGDVGIPAVIVSRKAFAALVARLSQGEHPTAHVGVALEPTTAHAFNVVARWPSPDPHKLPGVVVVGAHYDHLGYGGAGSLAPGMHAPHPGADDNASGAATLLEVARILSTGRAPLRRDVVLVAFSGEELGVLGSEAFVEHTPAGLSTKDMVAMINMDMVGRLRGNALQVFGTDTASEWPGLLSSACERAHVDCVAAAGGGFGASDHTSFYAAGVPVLHLFTGVHDDYHKPSDTADKLNAAGMAQVALVAESLAREVGENAGPLSYRRTASPPPHGDVRGFGASLGTVPDYVGPPKGQRGMLLAGVRPGGAADQAGLARGDILISLGEHAIGNVEDLMYVLRASKPNTTMKATVLRDGRPFTVDVTLQRSPHAR